MLAPRLSQASLDTRPYHGATHLLAHGDAQTPTMRRTQADNDHMALMYLPSPPLNLEKIAPATHTLRFPKSQIAAHGFSTLCATIHGG